MYRGERFNAWTHFVGALLSVAGAVVLIVLATLQEDTMKIVGASVFGGTLVLLYSASTLYHSVRGRAKAALRKLDHLSIYLLIAGTYTPFCLVTLRGPWGWSLLGMVWGLAGIGMFQEIKPRSERRMMSLVIYAVMGWIILVALHPLLQRIETAGFVWLATGGMLYTLGIVFYAFDTRFRHWHGIWHLFVMGGSLTHFISVAFYVL